MEALLVSPLRPWQIIVGKVAPYLVVGFVSVIGVIVEARLVFDVPLRGSLALLLVEGLLLHSGVAVARHPDFGPDLVAARGHAGRAGRHDAADDAAVGLHLSDREHAVAASGDLGDRAGALVRAGRAQHHAEGGRASSYLWRQRWCCW